jgi:sec-independent protein translocase protein TatA
MTNLAFISNFLTGGDGIIILIIVLIIFGPKKLPELARGMGQAIKEFNKAKDEVTQELTKSDVTVQPAPGQQPRQPAELPAAPAPAAAPVAPAPVPAAQTQAAPAAQTQAPVDQIFGTGTAFQRPNPAPQDTHPAGQA